MRMKFKEWVTRLDGMIAAEFGMGLHDFPDLFFYRDFFDEGWDVASAFEEFVAVQAADSSMFAEVAKARGLL